MRNYFIATTESGIYMGIFSCEIHWLKILSRHAHFSVNYGGKKQGNEQPKDGKKKRWKTENSNHWIGENWHSLHRFFGRWFTFPQPYWPGCITTKLFIGCHVLHCHVVLEPIVVILDSIDCHLTQNVYTHLYSELIWWPNGNSEALFYGFFKLFLQ